MFLLYSALVVSCVIYLLHMHEKIQVLNLHCCRSDSSATATFSLPAFVVKKCTPSTSHLKLSHALIMQDFVMLAVLQLMWPKSMNRVQVFDVRTGVCFLFVYSEQWLWS